MKKVMQMVKNLNPARMTFKIEVGSEQSTDKKNPNTGNSIKTFVTSFSVWAGKWTLSMNQTLTLAGSGIKDASVFFIRHNDALNGQTQLRLNDAEVYQIDSVSFDDGLPPDGFDLITCHKVVKSYG
ncbi:phage head closure protein [Liquorilactobacillus mali]|uniref:phage head closure protein n=1 Tax=Liquorilactobacillus mali TaxID=1618 RepID=UPI0029535E09|nr:phage head closure protein [Liquorilactobacillus mali]